MALESRACVDKNTCISCGSCYAVCPVDSIKPGPDGKARVDNTCISCGACVAVCPVQCIEIKMTEKTIEWT